MLAEHIRDTAATAVVFGLFASSWFGWAQQSPPRSWRKPLVAGSVTALAAAVAGASLAWRYWRDGTAFDGDTSRTFGVIVGIEFGAAAIGAVALAVSRRGSLIPVWVAFVVGVHLFPVASLIRYPVIHVVAALITLAAITAVPVARSRSMTPSAVVGAATGAILLGAAVFSAVAAAVGP